MAAHHEIREAAHAMVALSANGEFSLAGIIAEMNRRGSAYSERTVRTHVTSRMCANAPKNHAIVYNDFWCVDSTGASKKELGSATKPTSGAATAVCP